MEAEVVNKLQKFKLSEKEASDVQLVSSDVIRSQEDCEMSLVGKIYGENGVNYTGLKQTMQKLWCAEGKLRVVELKNKLYQFVFSRADERQRVLDKRPWNFDNQLIVIQPWRKDIEHEEEVFQTSQVWIQAWHIPIQWLTTATAWKLGQIFTKCSNVVIPEKGSKEGRYAKLLVEIDLRQPLIRGVNINLEGEKSWVAFKYDHLPLFCFYCGKIGHGEKSCGRRMRDLKNSELEEGQFGEWLKVDNGRFISKGRMMNMLSKVSSTNTGAEAIEKRKHGKESECYSEGGEIESCGRKPSLGKEGMNEGRNVEGTREAEGTETAVSLDPMVVHGEPKENSSEEVREIGQMEEGLERRGEGESCEGEGGQRVLRELDYNITITLNKPEARITKEGSWKRKCKTQVNHSRGGTGVGKENVDVNLSIAGKRNFGLVDEVESVESHNQTGKKM